MPRFLTILFCLAALSTAAFAQDDHNDAGPLVVGYAIVTTTNSGSPFSRPGLPGECVVFETFGYRSQDPALQAGVLPATLTTRTVLFATAGIRLTRNVGVAITNPGSGDAVVTMTLRRANGSVTSSKTITIPTRQQISRFMDELFADVPEVPRDFDGTLTVTSNTPVAILALRFRGTHFSTIPITSLSPFVEVPELIALPNWPPGTRNSVLLPQFAAQSLWASEIIVMNNSPVPLTVRIDLFKQDGTPLVTTLNRQTASSFQDLVIRPGGLIRYSPRDANFDSDF